VHFTGVRLEIKCRLHSRTCHFTAGDGVIVTGSVKSKVRSAQPAVGEKKARIADDGLLEQAHCSEQILVVRRLAFQRAGLQIKVDCNGFFRRCQCDGGFFAERDFRLELSSNRLRDFTLENEDVGDLAIVGVRPKMRIGARVDELGVDT